MESRYYLIWRNRLLTSEAESIEDMVAALEEAAQTLREMQEAGVWLNGGTEQDYAYLVTEDEDVALEYGFEPEDQEDEEDADYDEEDEEDEEGFNDDEYSEEGFNDDEEDDEYNEDEDEDEYEELSDEDYN